MNTNINLFYCHHNAKTCYLESLPPWKYSPESMVRAPLPSSRRVPPCPALPMGLVRGALARVITVDRPCPAIPPHAAPPGPLPRPSLPHVAQHPPYGVRRPRAPVSTVRFWIACARCPHHPPTTHHLQEKQWRNSRSHSMCANVPQVGSGGILAATTRGGAIVNKIIGRGF